jgi:hypothetical protein
MARAAKTTTTTKPAARGRKSAGPASITGKAPAKVTKPVIAAKRAAIVAPVSGRKPGRLAAAAVPAKAPGKVAKAAAAPKPAPAVAAPALKLSKDELRVQVEKLEHANATLRAKNREANRTAKTAAARIAELEEIVAGLEKKAESQAAKGEQAARPSLAKRPRRGLAMPAGVADQEPAPLDEAGAAPEEQLGHS